MKKYNLRKSIAEKGGLMIEALAMLGLIAVVTPCIKNLQNEQWKLRILIPQQRFVPL